MRSSPRSGRWAPATGARRPGPRRRRCAARLGAALLLIAWLLACGAGPAGAQGASEACRGLLDQIRQMQAKVAETEVGLGEVERSLAAELEETERNIAETRDLEERRRLERLADELAQRLGQIERTRGNLGQQIATMRELAQQLGCEPGASGPAGRRTGG